MNRRLTSPLQAATRSLQAVTTGARLLLAAKTAVAATAAWYLAPLIPFAVDAYSYYAPLGVVVSMYPTIAGSARSGVQTLIGLALGIALGLGAVYLGALGVLPGIALGLLVAIGVMLGAIQALGAGKDWITIAALFVLLIGGTTDAETFSVTYIVTMAFGVVVGIVANLIVPPPLFVGRAGERLSSLRDTLAAHLSEMADAVSENSFDEERLTRANESLGTMLNDVVGEVHEADLSRRANPRAFHRQSDQHLNAMRLRALERTTFFTRDLADALVQLPAGDPSLDDDARNRLAEAIRSCARLVGTEPRAPETDERMEETLSRLDSYLAVLDPGTDRRATLAETATAAECLRRIVDAVRPLRLGDEKDDQGDEPA